MSHPSSQTRPWPGFAGSLQDLEPVSPWVCLHRAQPDASAPALAAWIADALREVIARRGQAVLSVSGGQSPIPMFQALRTQELDWHRVTITLVDERLVAEDHPASNARTVREHLLCGPAAAAHFVSLVGPGQPHALQAVADRADQQMAELGPADLMVLGMGVDGHTASLFPQCAGLEAALDLAQPRTCVPVWLDPLPEQAPFHRISSTLAHILRSGQLVLSVAGREKQDLLRQALRAPDPRWPISHVLYQGLCPVLVWLAS